MKHLAWFVCALAATALPSLAAAQSAPSAPAVPPAAVTPAEAPAAVDYHATREAGRTVVGPIIDVLGRYQRPYAFAVSGRSPLGYTAADEVRSFVPAVVGAVRGGPF